jgi:hypothetical protein
MPRRSLIQAVSQHGTQSDDFYGAILEMLVAAMHLLRIVPMVSIQMVWWELGRDFIRIS